jgi:hypothetical protein
MPAQVSILTALKAFNIEGSLSGEPTNEAEFQEMFQVVVGVTEDNSAILSSDLSNLGVTWAEIAEKQKEIQEERDLRLLRRHRDALLAQTDHWLLSDRTPTQEQLDYRQALRDITNTYTSLEDVVWPTKPAN